MNLDQNHNVGCKPAWENYASAEQSAGKDASSNISEGKHENSAKGEKTWVIKFTIVFYVYFTMQRKAFGLAFVFSLVFSLFYCFYLRLSLVSA